ncbi:hypothetical protein DVH05_026944 [Phytophthora capsici]|nr:hypothetical protein DVH05_026944 [Phytophthora capsici]
MTREAIWLCSTKASLQVSVGCRPDSCSPEDKLVYHLQSLPSQSNAASTVSRHVIPQTLASISIKLGMSRSFMALWSVYVPVSVFTAVVYLGQHSTTAHSWIDCFDTNRTKIYHESASYIYGGSGGNGFCEGYGAGYPGRGDTDIGTGYTFKMLENEVEAGTAVCETVGEDTYTNTDWRKRISVAPGVTVYYAYLPNGHIVKDKKAIGTQHGVYWTGEAGSSLTSTLEMTQENLMDGYTLDFDDGNCGETYDYNGNPGGRAGDGKPCIGSFVVPTGTAPGIYSMVWYWTFWLDNEASYVDQSQARGYFGAAYSTCFQVEVTSGSGSSVTATESPSTTAPEVTQLRHKPLKDLSLPRLPPRRQQQLPQLRSPLLEHHCRRLLQR